MQVIKMFSLKGQVALVTGAGRGLGREMAIALAEAGADVAVVDIDVGTARETEKEIEKLGRESRAISADISKEKDVRSMVKKVKATFGRIDILVNNAGVVNNYPAEKMRKKDWDRVMEIDATGVFLCSKEAGKEMIKQKKGNIINIASMSGIIANTPQPQVHYNSAKAAVIMLTKSLAAEWARYNIRVNAIAPGYMGTEMVRRVISEYGKYWFPLIPMGRIGKQEEIRGPVVFLASSASSYVTGSVLVMDGGYTVW